MPIKSVLLYVTKYVTKPTLKTYAAFKAVTSIFDKYTDILNGLLTRQEKAQTLMTKIANALSAKSDMGSPMICMYLLGHPDHYTDYDFSLLYWPTFIREVRRPWMVENPLDNDADKIAIIKQRGRIVGLSPVFDYIFRGPKLENMSLYEWSSRSKQVKLNHQMENLLSSFHTPKHGYNTSTPDSVVIRFLNDHPLANTHATYIYPPHCKQVPNLVGGSLPQKDQGDHEYYCSTMLTLFKPWRSGYDLKSDTESWDSAFSINKFDSKHMVIMKNMNIRYECMDAADDFYTQLKSGGAVVPGITPTEYEINEMLQRDETEEFEGLNEVYVNSEDVFPTIVGKKELKQRIATTEMISVMKEIGWQMPLMGQNFLQTKNIVSINLIYAASRWKTIISKKREAILNERLSERRTK
ncbi:hypothetical protein C0992_007672 [Termitomyces sp. T32_za158]|nr:hypothetical protein C0992_007672 [Termitomyces sp. T32_za158]